MKTPFKKIPKCEVCENEEASSFSCMAVAKNGDLTEWKFCGECTSDKEAYYMEFDRFFDSPTSTVDWLAHVHEKGVDWKNFMDMMHRFREATDSYGAL